MSEAEAPAGTAMVEITRTYDAPREEVFRAWLDPGQVSRWYGPEGMEAPRDRITIEPRVGGKWELTMVGGGGEHALSYEITELVEPELLVMRSEPMPGMQVEARIEFHDQDGATRMELTDGPYPADVAGRAGGGWEGAFEKLGRVVEGG